MPASGMKQTASELIMADFTSPPADGAVKWPVHRLSFVVAEGGKRKSDAGTATAPTNKITRDTGADV
jgi:hypothetical protein